MRFMIANAERNEKKGLPVEKVISIILKADKAKNPKLSYTVGKDAFMANLATKIPQSWQNRLIKLGMKARMK